MSTRFIITSLILFTWLSLGSIASAKDPELPLHVLGVVAAIDATHVDVKTTKGQVVSVLLNKQVQFKNKKNPKSVTPPEVGDRVIIEATKDKQKVTATIVHYSPVKIPSLSR